VGADVTGGCAIGVDLGGTKILAGAVDRELGVIHQVRRPAPAEDAATLLGAIAAAVEEVRDRAGVEVAAVGYGIPALIDADRGVAVSSVHLPINGIPFARAMADRVGLPAFVDNDANLALLAEHRRGAAAGAGNALMLTLGTGIGGGIVIDGRIYRGSRGAAGELGHMIVWADGPDCGPGCPSRGCLEAVASGTALVRAARAAADGDPGSGLGRARAAGGEIDGPLVTELAAAGDPGAAAVIAGVGRWLGVGLTSLLNIFDPEVVVIGGGVIAAGEQLLGPARAVVAERALEPARDRARIVAAHFGPESGMLGAALLAYDSIEGRTA
jgi:glucokinase